MQAYLTRWNPPRKDFVTTMTDVEKDLMQQHGAWLNATMAAGPIVAHGPVMDPSGPYGVALWRLEEGQDLAALLAKDPIIQAGVGHYEHFPMLHVSTRS